MGAEAQGWRGRLLLLGGHRGDHLLGGLGICRWRGGQGVGRSDPSSPPLEAESSSGGGRGTRSSCSAHGTLCPIGFASPVPSTAATLLSDYFFFSDTIADLKYKRAPRRAPAASTRVAQIRQLCLADVLPSPLLPSASDVKREEGAIWRRTQDAPDLPARDEILEDKCHFIGCYCSSSMSSGPLYLQL